MSVCVQVFVAWRACLKLALLCCVCGCGCVANCMHVRVVGCDMVLSSYLPVPVFLCVCVCVTLFDYVMWLVACVLCVCVAESECGYFVLPLVWLVCACACVHMRVCL